MCSGEQRKCHLAKKINALNLEVINIRQCTFKDNIYGHSGMQCNSSSSCEYSARERDTEKERY